MSGALAALPLFQVAWAAFFPAIFEHIDTLLNAAVHC